MKQSVRATSFIISTALLCHYFPCPDIGTRNLGQLMELFAAVGFASRIMHEARDFTIDHVD